VQRHEGDELARVDVGVGVRVQRDLLEEAVQRRVGGPTVVLDGDGEELLEVLEPAFGLERALPLELVLVARLVEDAAHDRGHRPAGEARLQSLDEAHEAEQSLDGGGRQARDALGIPGRLPEAHPDARRVRLEAGQRRRPEPAARHVDHAQQTLRVAGVHE